MEALPSSWKLELKPMPNVGISHTRPIVGIAHKAISSSKIFFVDARHINGSLKIVEDEK